MKKIKNTIKLLAVVAATGMGATSCSLDLLPLNDVVLENFWTDKADVESVVASCYLGMRQNGYITDMLVWGEDRSDNVEVGSGVSASLNSLMNGALKTTNIYCNWAAMYNVINRCNTVLYYAPQVAEEDPNYTASDLKANVAECKFLRAFSYLTLIKTFRDVPFTLEPSIDDTIDMKLSQTSFEDILDALIADIESCKDDAPRKYSDNAFNTGKVTRAAMYSLLAEMYLWRASDANLSADRQSDYYRRCIEACDWVLNYKVQQYKNKDTNGEDITSQVDEHVWAIFGYPLLSETYSSLSMNVTAGRNTYAMVVPNGTYRIFSQGNSFESIFEVAFSYGSETVENSAVAAMYGYSSADVWQLPQVLGSQNLMAQLPTASTYSNDNLFSVTTDYRALLPFSWVSGSGSPINKYVMRSIPTNYHGSGTISEDDYKLLGPLSGIRIQLTGQQEENWILYRMTEIMLFRAEAEIELAALMDPAAVPTTATFNDYREGATLTGSAADLYTDAYNLITAVYLRSNPAAQSSNRLNTYAPTLNTLNTLNALRTYLMNERRREFLFEGKRYYDLVRMARREGNTDRFRATLASKYSGGSNALKVKMMMMDFMYMPVHKDQMELNPNLVQNAAYNDEEENVKN